MRKASSSHDLSNTCHGNPVDDVYRNLKVAREIINEYGANSGLKYINCQETIEVYRPIYEYIILNYIVPA